MRLTSLFLIFLVISIKTLGQDSLWEKKVFNDLLAFNVPAKSEYATASFIKAIGGAIGTDFYGFQFYDSVFLPIQDENQFQISLTAFMSGRASDPALKNYDIEVTDTSIGGTKGLMAHFTTHDTSEAYKQLYYYVTIANNRYYWFYVYSTGTEYSDERAHFFFRSILFETKNIKEKSFRLTPVHLKKKAG